MYIYSLGWKVLLCRKLKNQTTNKLLGKKGSNSILKNLNLAALFHSLARALSFS